MEDDKLTRIVEWHELVETRANLGAAEKRIWIDAARILFKPGRRDVCWVCGKWRAITEAHHVVPLTDQYDRGFKYPDNAFVWLCPNHHAIAHLFALGEGKRVLSGNRDKKRDLLVGDLSEKEFEQVIKLMRMSAREVPDA